METTLTAAVVAGRPSGRGARHARMAGLAMALALAGCADKAWTPGQLDEAYRLCRAEIGFPKINVFESSEAGYTTFMCRCTVEFMAERLTYAKFTDGKHTLEANRNILLGRTSCAARHRSGER